jgi:hypothetical protein
MATTPLYYAQQFIETTLNVGGGITDVQTTGIILQSVSGIDITKPGIICMTYAEPLSTSTAEFITYTSINGSNELQGVTRGAEGYGAKTHANGARVAFVVSESHFNNLNAMFDATGLDIKQIATPANPDSGRNKLYFKSDGKLYSLTSAGVEGEVGASASVGLFQQVVINGNFDIWQRNTTFTTPNDDVFLADRWNNLADGNGAWTYSRATDVPSEKSMYSFKAVNVTANKQGGIVQFIENVDTKKLAGKTVSLSFQAKTTTGKEIGNLRATVLAWNSTADTVTSDVVGTWAGNGTDPTWATNWTAEVAGANKALTADWQKFTVQGIVLDTASTANLAVVIWVDDTTITAGDEFFVTQVQMNVGSTASEFYPKTFGEELRSCQRYFEKSVGYSVVPNTTDGFDETVGRGIALTTTVVSIVNGLFAAEKHRVPTVTFYASDSATGAGTANRFRDDSVSGLVDISSPTSTNFSTKAIVILKKNVPFTAGRWYGFNWIAEAEL